MQQFIRASAILPCALALAACQPPPNAAHGGRGQQVTITAQTGSEVVLNKHVAAGNPAPAQAGGGHDLTLLQPDQADSALLPRTADPDPAPAARPPRAPEPLGKLRVNPWAVHAGETLLDALRRFAERSGHAVRKPEPYPVWEITTDARFEGAFEGALSWLSEGFSHTVPRPVITLYPNQVVRLDAE